MTPAKRSDNEPVFARAAMRKRVTAIPPCSCQTGAVGSVYPRPSRQGCRDVSGHFLQLGSEIPRTSSCGAGVHQ